MRSRALLAAVLLVSAAACGARSTLQDPAGNTVGSGGTGPSSATSTAAVGSTTGATSGPGGGPSGLCSTLVSVEPLVELVASDTISAMHDPWFEVGGDGKVVAFTRREVLEAPPGNPDLIQATRLAPWSTWPPTIDFTAHVVETVHGSPFVAAVEPKGTFAVQVAPLPAPNAPLGCDLAAMFGVSVEGPSGPDAFTAHLSGDCTVFPISIATADDGSHFIASDIPAGDKGAPLRGMVTTVLGAYGQLIASPNLACASNRLVGDVLATGPDFLFVQSASDSLDCAAKGTARRLFLRRFQGTIEDSFAVVDGFDDMVFARILPRQGGSWIFYRESGASSAVQPPGMAIAFGTDSAAGTAFPITDAVSGQMAVAELAGGFVVAFVDLSDPSAPTIIIRVYSPTGALVTQTSFSTAGAWLTGDRLTLISSPEGGRFLVGWTGTSGVVGANPAMFARRFDCLLPL